MATKKEDIRITKTKQALSKAFFEMLVEMSIDNITINDLCQRADVRRATFYKHFSDKSDFIFSLIKSAREKFDQQAESATQSLVGIKEYYLYCAESVMNYLLRYEATIKGVMKSDIRPTFIEIFVKQNYEDTVKRLEMSRQNGLALFTSSDIIASMLIGGVSHAIVNWFESEEKCAPEKLISDISVFIEKTLG